MFAARCIISAATCWQSADARGAVIELAGIGPRIGDKLGEIFHRHPVAPQKYRRAPGRRHRQQVFGDVDGHLV